MSNTYIADVFMRFRATIWNVIRVHRDLLESAQRYGLIPMQVPHLDLAKEDTAIHFVVPSQANGSVMSQVQSVYILMKRKRCYGKPFQTQFSYLAHSHCLAEKYNHQSKTAKIN